MDIYEKFHFSARPFEESVDQTTSVTAAAGHLSLAYSALGTAVDEAILMLGETGNRNFHVLEPIGEFEADLARERTVAGLAAARRRGARLGRRPALDRGQIARAKRLAKAGRSLREISEVLGCSPNTAMRA